MEYKKYVSDFSNMYAQNKLLTFAVFGILVGMIFLGMRMETLLTRQKILLVPLTGGSAPLLLSGNRGGDEYLAAMATYIAGLRFHYTPGNAREQFERILRMYDARNFSVARDELFSLADSVESARINSVFYLKRAAAMLLDGKPVIEVIGTQRLEGEGFTGNDKKKTYMIEYEIKAGTFKLTSIWEREEKS